MSQIHRSTIETRARKYIARMQKLNGSSQVNNVPQGDVEKAVREVIRASERFVKARGDQVISS